MTYCYVFPPCHAPWAGDCEKIVKMTIFAPLENHGQEASNKTMSEYRAIKMFVSGRLEDFLGLSKALDIHQ